MYHLAFIFILHSKNWLVYYLSLHTSFCLVPSPPPPPSTKANQGTVLSLKFRRLIHIRVTSLPWLSVAWNGTEWHLTNFVLGTRSQNILYVLIISSVTFLYASDAIQLIQSRGREAAWVSGRFSLIQTSVSYK